MIIMIMIIIIIIVLDNNKIPNIVLDNKIIMI